jgi:hypothetical protein
LREEVVLKVARVVLWARVLFLSRELPSDVWATFYRQMERGFHPVVGSVWVPLLDLGVVGTPSLAFSFLYTSSVFGDIPYALSIHDVPSVGPTGPLARG